jgi:BON domain
LNKYGTNSAAARTITTTIPISTDDMDHLTAILSNVCALGSMADGLKALKQGVSMHTFRAVVLSLLIVLIALVAFSYLSGSTWSRFPRATHPAAVGTSGAIDVDAARERGAEVGAKVAVAAAKVKETTAEAALTSKIKAKMVLDDRVKARAIDVTTDHSIVTLSGTVGSASEHDRAVRLARETAGVDDVVDHLRVEIK